MTGHKKDEEPPDDTKWHAVYDMVGATGINGIPKVKVNGKKIYSRVLIQKRWIERCIDNDNGIYECIVPIENLKYLKNNPCQLVGK